MDYYIDFFKRPYAILIVFTIYFSPDICDLLFHLVTFILQVNFQFTDLVVRETSYSLLIITETEKLPER